MAVTRVFFLSFLVGYVAPNNCSLGNGNPKRTEHLSFTSTSFWDLCVCVSQTFSQKNKKENSINKID
jgi:hypothetical protein